MGDIPEHGNGESARSVERILRWNARSARVCQRARSAGQQSAPPALRQNASMPSPDRSAGNNRQQLAKPSMLDDQTLGGRQLDDGFRLVGQEFVKRRLDAGEDRIVVGEHHPAGDHSRVEILEAAERTLVEVNVEVREAELRFRHAGGGLRETALVEMHVL